MPKRRQEIWKRNAFYRGLRSALTIPESNPFEIPFRTVGIYPENDIAFFENCDRPASSSEKRFIGKFALCSGIAHPLNALKSGSPCGEGWGWCGCPVDKLRFKLYPHLASAFVLMPDGHLPFLKNSFHPTSTSRRRSGSGWWNASVAKRSVR